MWKSLIDEMVYETVKTYNTNNPVQILNELFFDIEYVNKADPKLLGNNSYANITLSTVFVRNDISESMVRFHLSQELGYIFMGENKKNWLSENLLQPKVMFYYATKLTRYYIVDSPDVKGEIRNNLTSCFTSLNS